MDLLSFTGKAQSNRSTIPPSALIKSNGLPETQACLGAPDHAKGCRSGCGSLLASSMMLVTALTPAIGYDKAAAIAGIRPSPWPVPAGGGPGAWSPQREDFDALVRAERIV